MIRRPRGVTFRLALLFLGAALLAAPSAFAAAANKSAKPPAPSYASQIEAQRKRIDEQQAMIGHQRDLLGAQSALSDSQMVRIAAQSARLATLDSQLVEMKKRLETLESQAGFPAWEDTLSERLRKVEAATQKPPEMPPDIVSAGDFPGSIRIPGSDAAIKFGGRIRTAVVLTLDPLGTDDRFLTNSIQVGVATTAGQAQRTNISARASRLNIEFRTPNGEEEIRAFFEGDFAGTANAFRLRHAYAQYRGFIVGQTWSTFSDPWVRLEDLDFEGVSSENIIRQPQLRYWWTHKPTTRIALAIETPSVSITGGQGVNLFPDVIARAFKGSEQGAHLQLAGVVRQIRGEETNGEVRSQWGAGGSISGVIIVPIKTLTDRIMYQANAGHGIARYINDLGSLGGTDAAFDTTTGNLHVISALGWYLGYEHKWKEWKLLETMNLRSTALWSLVSANNFDFQAPNTYKHTNRLALNLVFSPSTRVDTGLEYIFGTRENKDGQSANANQFQLVMLVRF
ncbi:MAG: DcaP family trimeric outer membrane transporter [Candidatus Eiseniibacteriota bacterium]